MEEMLCKHLNVVFRVRVLRYDIAVWHQSLTGRQVAKFVLISQKGVIRCYLGPLRA